ncbi:hypothetical protein BDR26DRAFT_938893 [Obelidium mucronatum]|nr:hypothetical protein BDR26DRAFT_938893 [Obelidium mucronatum]
MTFYYGLVTCRTNLPSCTVATLALFVTLKKELTTTKQNISTSITGKMLVAIFTKPLAKKKFVPLKGALGLIKGSVKDLDPDVIKQRFKECPIAAVDTVKGLATANPTCQQDISRVPLSWPTASSPNVVHMPSLTSYSSLLVPVTLSRASAMALFAVSGPSTLPLQSFSLCLFFAVPALAADHIYHLWISKGVMFSHAPDATSQADGSATTVPPTTRLTTTNCVTRTTFEARPFRSVDTLLHW